jgi:hypothetical protein
VRRVVGRVRHQGDVAVLLLTTGVVPVRPSTGGTRGHPNAGVARPGEPDVPALVTADAARPPAMEEATVVAVAVADGKQQQEA